MALFPDGHWPKIVEDEFNRFTNREYERVRDFIILHYHATQRDDAPLWNYVRTMSIPETLERKMAMFRENGRFFREDDELFGATSWVAVLLGQNVFPRAPDPIVSTLSSPGLDADIDGLGKSIHQLAERLPDHEEFLKRYSPARPLTTGSPS